VAVTAAARIVAAAQTAGIPRFQAAVDNTNTHAVSTPILDWRYALPWLQSTARHACRNRADGDDAAQEAASRLCQAIGRGGQRRVEVSSLGRPLAKKLREGTIDLARQRRRRERRERSGADVDPARTVDAAPAPTGGAVGEAAMAALIEQVVVPALGGLPRTDLDLWLAAKLDGRGWKAAGETAGLNRSAIRQARQRILSSLRTGGGLGRVAPRHALVAHGRRNLHASVVRWPAWSAVRYIECDSITPHRVCHGR
jgi:DNA-directed RNA polymerase specialized sigma24 family protein